MTHHKRIRPEAAKIPTGANETRAAFRWGQVPQVAEQTLAILKPGCKIELFPEEIGTQAVAEVLKCRIRTVQEMCNQGMLAEGKDWRKINTRGARGEYRIAQRAILEILMEYRSPQPR